MATTTIPLIGSIYRGTAEMIYDFLEFAKSIDADISDIDMPIMSMGGSAVDGLRGYAALKASGLNITTKAPGGCDSSATLFFAAGQKRISSKAGIFLCHNPYLCGGTVNGTGTADDHQATADELRLLEDQYAGIYAASSSMPAEHWKMVMATNKSISAQQAYEWGFVTELTDSMPVELDAKTSDFMASDNSERLNIMAEKHKSFVDKALERIFGAKAEGEAAAPVAYNLTTDQGEIVVHSDGGLAVGIEVTNPDGTPVGDGVYTPSNGGDKFRVTEGKISELIDMEEEALAAIELAMASRIEQVKAEMRAEFDAKLSQIEARAKAAEAKIAEANAAKPRAPWPKTLPPVTGGENTNAEPQAQKKIVVNADGSSQSTLKRK